MDFNKPFGERMEDNNNNNDYNDRNDGEPQKGFFESIKYTFHGPSITVNIVILLLLLMYYCSCYLLLLLSVQCVLYSSKKSFFLSLK